MIRRKMICCAVVIAAIFILDAGAQTFSCDASLSTPLCPGTVAQCTCVVTSIVSTTRWSFTGPNNAMYCTSLLLSQIGGANCGTLSGSCGSFLTAANQPPAGSSPCQTSTLTITANSNISGVVANCTDVVPNTTIGSMMITIVAPPSTPIITVPSNYSDPLIVNWTSVPTATSYNVSINGSTPVSLNANATTYNFTGLTNNTTYNISVVAINCAGNSSTTVPWPPPTTTQPPTTSSSQPTSSPMASSSSSSTTSATTQPQPPTPSPDIGPIVGGVVGGGGGALVLAAVVVIVVVVVWKKKGNGGAKSKEDRVELQKSGGTAERGHAPDTGALYQDPNAIKRAEGPAGDMYAVADKPKWGAPADAGGALYQDPKDIEHTKGPAGEVYAVADKKPKEVPHQPAPTGDMYAVADTKKPSKRKHTQPEEEEEGGGYAGVSL